MVCSFEIPSKCVLQLFYNYLQILHCTTIDNILLMRDCDYALAWKVADSFPELSELFEFQNKLSLVIE